MSLRSMPSRSSLPTLAEIVDKIGLGPAQLRFIFTGGGVWFADGSEVLLISAVTSSVAAEWNLDPMERGSMVTIVYIGVLIGNLISGPICDRHGRRQMILASYIGVFAFSMMSSFTMSYWALCFWRLFVGMAFGLGQPPCNVLAAEMTPAKWRVVVNALSQGLFSIGEVYAALLIFLDDSSMHDLNWRRLLQLGAIPAFVFWVIGSAFLQQSPFFLAQCGKNEEAREVLTVMRSDNCLPHVSVDFAPAQPVETPPVGSSDESAFWFSRFTTLGSPSLFVTTAIMTYTCFTVNLVYYGALYGFPNLLPMLKASGAGVSDAHGTSAAMQLMVGAIWELPGVALAAFFGMCMARRPVLKTSAFVVVVSLVLFAGGATAAGPGRFPVLAWHIGYYLIKCWSIVMFLTTYIYIAEVYPTSVRATGVAFNIAFGRLGSIISPLVYEGLLDLTGTFATFFYVLASAVLVNVVFIHFLPIETYNVALTDSVAELEKQQGQDYGATENVISHR